MNLSRVSRESEWRGNIASSYTFYDGDNLIEETNSSGTAVARYTQGLNIDEPLAMLRSGTASLYEADGLGSVTSLTNSSGTVVETYTYDSFGNLTASTGSIINPFRYTGREFDTETGLYYYRARYYDPQAGRFLREDPIRFVGGKNFYPYVANYPVNRKDPLGLWQLTIGGGEGLGGLITFGVNSGQWNFGLYTGGGEGFFTKLDMSDSGGCHKFGAHGGVRADTEFGLGAGLTADINVEEGSDPEVSGTAGIPNVIGINVNPAKPHEPPHVVLPFGAGGFAGFGFSFHSPPSESQCGCSGK